MSSIKQLASQTVWYGASSVIAKLAVNLLTPIFTYILSSPEGVISLGRISLIYSYFAFLNILFTYGMETAFFRFNNKNSTLKDNIFNTCFGSILISTLSFCIILFLFNQQIDHFLELGDHPEYINLAIVILFFDTVQTIPFARLRNENKPRKYALIRIAGVTINIISVIFFMMLLPKLATANPVSFWASITNKYSVVTFVLLSNLIQTVFTFLALYKEWKDFSFRIDTALWKKMFRYSSPMILIGMAGMVNEVIDRQMLIKLIDNTETYAQTVQSIYSQNYKLSIVVTMFITAFRMAAEPFFFSKALDKDAPQIYARVMKWFVITLSIAYLVTALFLDDLWIKWLGPSYRSGKTVVPILLFANVCTGIYYNLSVWYKVGNKMWIGVIITLFGAAITVAGNYLFIPQYEMLASAWTTATCYSVMVVLCYFLGQRYFPVPYPVKRIIMYLALTVVLYLIQHTISNIFSNNEYLILRLASGFVLLLVFLLLTYWIERKDIRSSLKIKV
ncbi:oligosaccharide flippase family protein [Sphingobacterium siyangense]|uniref:oligosaccharide flippase family protein n=1 Tax=Sphingobacterium siyangense TaxID=459529 RepID=UPI002FDB5C50